jgi:hypothetical protein
MKRKRLHPHHHVLPELDNTKIDYFFKRFIKDDRYVPCVTKDELYHMQPKKCFVIINSANSTDPTDDEVGRHWTMLYTCDPLYAIVFDSYGSLMCEPTEDYITRCANKYNLLVIDNDDEYQTMGSSSCGFYCIYVLLHLLAGYHFHDILKQFNDKTISRNERYLYKWFNTTKIQGKSILHWLRSPIPRHYQL